MIELDTGSENLDLMVFGHQKAWTVSVSDEGSGGRLLERRKIRKCRTGIPQLPLDRGSFRVRGICQ